MRHSHIIARLCLGAALASPTAALGVVSVSLGLSASDNNLPMQKSSSLAGSGSIAFGVTDFLRLGYTHRQEVQESEGWAQQTDATTEETTYTPKFSRTHVFANSVDATLILYQGFQFTPYLIGGGVIKNYVYDEHFQLDDGSKAKVRTKVSTKKPVPNVGAGVGIRLNREFSLKVSYVASPGYAQDPNGEIKNVWDAYTTVQIGYDL